MKFGFKFQPGGLWVGAHYSTHNRRWCVNLLPCCTFWVALSGGKAPTSAPQHRQPHTSSIVHDYRRHLYGTAPLNESGRAAFYEDARKGFEG